MLLPIEETITDLTDSDKTPVNSKLIDLSNLNPEELRVFKQTWEDPFSFDA